MFQEHCLQKLLHLFVPWLHQFDNHQKCSKPHHLGVLKSKSPAVGKEQLGKWPCYLCTVYYPYLLPVLNPVSIAGPDTTLQIIWYFHSNVVTNKINLEKTRGSQMKMNFSPSGWPSCSKTLNSSNDFDGIYITTTTQTAWWNYVRDIFSQGKDIFQQLILMHLINRVFFHIRRYYVAFFPFTVSNARKISTYPLIFFLIFFTVPTHLKEL